MLRVQAVLARTEYEFFLAEAEKVSWTITMARTVKSKSRRDEASPSDAFSKLGDGIAIKPEPYKLGRLVHTKSTDYHLWYVANELVIALLLNMGHSRTAAPVRVSCLSYLQLSSSLSVPQQSPEP